MTQHIKHLYLLEKIIDGEMLMKRVRKMIEEDMENNKHPEHTLEKWDCDYFKTLKHHYVKQKDYWEHFFHFTQ